MDTRLSDNRFALLVALSVLLAAALLCAGTYRDLIAAWSRGETFAHCFAILPISLWLIWQRRAELSKTRKSPWVWGFLLLVPVSLAWFLSELASVEAGKHLAVVMLVPLLIMTVLGKRLAWSIAFPLAYLVFLVPIGEGLVPTMMDITATLTVMELKLIGMPVYKDGMYFSIPSGDFEVARACSGIRYLIASLALGAVYAYLTYVSMWRRAAFLALAIIVPIAANSLRAFGIVMIAHLSEMKYATGADHLVYGWFFFGLVVFAMFWLGSFFRDTAPAQSESLAAAGAADAPLQRGALLVIAFLSVVAVASGPTAAWALVGQPSVTRELASGVPCSTRWLGWADHRQIGLAAPLSGRFLGGAGTL